MQDGLSLARQEVCSPNFAHQLSELSVESSASIALGWHYWQCPVTMPKPVKAFTSFSLSQSDYHIMMIVWASALCIRSTLIPTRLTDPQQFHYCTDSNPGTGADDTFVLKHGVWCNATWPSHSQPATAAEVRAIFKSVFLPEYFDCLFVYLLLVYLVLFMH